jgi:hypothetical protein
VNGHHLSIDHDVDRRAKVEIDSPRTTLPDQRMRNV